MTTLDVDSKHKKKKGAEYFGLDKDITQDWNLMH